MHDGQVEGRSRGRAPRQPGSYGRTGSEQPSADGPQSWRHPLPRTRELTAGGTNARRAGGSGAEPGAVGGWGRGRGAAGPPASSLPSRVGADLRAPSLGANSRGATAAGELQVDHRESR